MAERDDADPGSPRNQPDENQPDEPPCVQEILRAIRDDLHGSRSMIESIYQTLTRHEATQQGEDVISLEEIYECIDDLLHNNQTMVSFISVRMHREPEAEERRRNDRRHSNNYRPERSIPKAVLACLVSIYNRGSDNQLKWNQMISLIAGAIEYAFDSRFAANHREAAQLVSERQRQMCIKTVEKTTRDNISKIFNRHNEINGYQISDNMYVSMSRIGCADRSKQERTTILSLLMISAVNHKVLCSMTTRSPHLQTMDQELSIENIFSLCVEYLDHNSYGPNVVPVIPRPDTSSAQAGGGATTDDETVVVGPRRTTFRLRRSPEQEQPGDPAQRSGDDRDADVIQDFEDFTRSRDNSEDEMGSGLQDILYEDDLSWGNFSP